MIPISQAITMDYESDGRVRLHSGDCTMISGGDSNLDPQSEELDQSGQDVAERSRLTPLPVLRRRTTAALHDIGNVLCGLLVSTEIAIDVARELPLGEMGAILAGDDPAEHRLERLADVLRRAQSEREVMVNESRVILDHVHHVEELVGRHRHALETGEVWCAAHSVFEDALRSQMTRINEHRIAIERSYAVDSESFVDRHRVLRVLVNLILNAIDAALAGSGPPQIAVCTHAAPDELRFAVSDNGVGFAGGAANELFAPGFSTKGESRGLGLSWSGNIARDLGGSIEAHSDGVGRGATFTLVLPRSTGAKEQ